MMTTTNLLGQDTFKSVSVNSNDTASFDGRLPKRHHDRCDKKEIRKVE